MFNHFIFILLSVTFLFSVPCIYSYQFPFLLYFTTAISVFPFSLIVYFPCLSLSISLTLYYVFISIGLFLSNQHQKMFSSYHSIKILWRVKHKKRCLHFLHTYTYIVVCQRNVSFGKRRGFSKFTKQSSRVISTTLQGKTTQVISV